MAVYRVAGKTVATAATINHAVAGIWNPHATDRVRVTELKVCITTATAVEPTIFRNTARGTAGSTVTPAIAQSDGRDVAPVSGFLLDLSAYTVQPTLDGAVALEKWWLPAAIGAGVMWVFSDPIVVGPGAGIVIVTGTAVAFPVSAVSIVAED